MATTGPNPFSFTSDTLFTSEPAVDEAAAAAAMSAASPAGAAASIIDSLAGVTGGVLDYLGEGATETAQAQAAAAQAQAQAAATAAANTPIGWATANPLTAGAVVLGTLYLLTKIAGR